LGKKFTSEDLFRIAAENLSSTEEVEFNFVCETSKFREKVGDVFRKDLGLSKDEDNMLERIFSKLRAGGIFKGGTR